jgi:hypothetical protein
MFLLKSGVFVCLTFAALPAQGVTDVGLTLDGGALTVLYGQTCGAVACAPFPGATIGYGTTRTLTHYAALNSPFVLAMGLPGPCFQFPGIANSVLLGAPIVTLAVGITNQPVLTAACRVAGVRYQLAMPPAGPIGLVVRFQSLGVSNSGMPAFGPAIEVTTQ